MKQEVGVVHIKRLISLFRGMKHDLLHAITSQTQVGLIEQKHLFGLKLVVFLFFHFKSL